MKRIQKMLESVAQDLNFECLHLGHKSQLTAERGRRRQTVSVRVIEGECELTSLVLAASDVKATQDRRRELARLAWQRNADTDLVTFTFDDEDCLVGRVHHPVKTLDHQELLLYVQSLARECDRFEYLLSGLDRH